MDDNFTEASNECNELGRLGLLSLRLKWNNLTDGRAGTLAGIIEFLEKC